MQPAHSCDSVSFILRSIAGRDEVFNDVKIEARGPSALAFMKVRMGEIDQEASPVPRLPVVQTERIEASFSDLGAPVILNASKCIPTLTRKLA